MVRTLLVTALASLALVTTPARATVCVSVGTAVGGEVLSYCTPV